MVSPRQAFEDNIRPADLLLRVYRLLECDTIRTDGELINTLRTTLGVQADEELMLIYNEIFVGLIRENANMPASALKRSALMLYKQEGVTSFLKTRNCKTTLKS